MRRLGITFLALLLTVAAAWAQELDDNDEEIVVDLKVNYRLGYRDGTYVPVDVLVINPLRDIKGYVEVRTYAGDTLQSPVYRIPAESPRSSRKRFRFHCRLNKTTRIETMLYDHRGREVLLVPPYMMVQPIQNQDLLGLVLDNEPTDYGFLNAAISLGGMKGRFYREEVHGDELHLLADFPQCYTPYNVIILGDIDPQRVSPRHRSLLLRYVQRGGTLVIPTGANAAKFRGTWVEELAGVRIGSTQNISGVQLAREVFEADERDGARRQRTGLVAELTPAMSDIKVRGKDRVLAALRTLGSGRVATLAVDASSHLLQDTAAYRNLWLELCTLRPREAELNYTAATNHYVERLPEISGIFMFAKSSVMIYFLAYFVLAIVINGLVCNFLKRRELAWLVLVVLSIAFTSYAMVYGTAGRAKQTLLDRVEVVRISQDGGASEIRTTAGVITARTSRVSLGLENEFSLAEDVKIVAPRHSMQRGRYSPAEVRPFVLTQSRSPRVDDFRIRASELRLLQVSSEIQAPGGIEGTIDYDGRDAHGFLRNRTGLTLTRPFLVIDGRTIKMKCNPDGTIQMATGARGRQHNLPREFLNEPGRGNLYQAMLNQLFAPRSEYGTPTTPAGPFLAAWVTDGPVGTIALDDPPEREYRATFLVADIRVERQGIVAGSVHAIPGRIRDAAWTTSSEPETRVQFRGSGGFGSRRLARSGSGPTTSVSLHVDPALAAAASGPLKVELRWRSQVPVELALMPVNNRRASPSPRVTLVDQRDRQHRRRDEYESSRTWVFENWQDYWQPSTGLLEGHLYVESASDQSNFYGPIHAGLSGVLETHQNTATAWESWR